MVKFAEWMAKNILARYGIPVPQGYVVSSPGEVREVTHPVVLKAQVLVGGRGKAGGIKFASTLEEARAAVGAILGMQIGGYTVKQVLVEDHLDIAQELYLSLLIDRSARSILLMASALGGMDIEAVPRDKIVQEHLPPLVGIQPFNLRALKASLGLPAAVGDKVASVAKLAFVAFRSEDAELLEINPLVVTPAGEVVAGDAKLIVDDSAVFRHEEYANLDQDLTPLENEARQKGIAFVQLDGNIGVIANGAGLTMATLDILNRLGGRPGIFLDLGGTDDPEKVKECLALMRRAQPKVVFLNIFGGITKSDTVALGVKEALEAEPLGVPVVARIKGLNEERAREILQSVGIEALGGFEEAARMAVAAAGGV